MTRLAAKRSVRVSVAPPRVGRTRAQRATEMTRLEFERERVSREIAVLERRLLGLKRDRSGLDDRLAKLQASLLLPRREPALRADGE
ncbi:MAG: hypothetical protein ACFB00_08715 [Parvularculaceae bacterium]